MKKPDQLIDQEILRYIRDSKVNKKIQRESIQRIFDAYTKAKHEGNKREIDALRKLLVRVGESI
jgi:uncharacterized protein (DUF2252 family)